VLDNLVQQQAVMLSTNWTFLVVTLLFAVAAAFIWLAPKPKGPVQAGAGGH
jgi:DHA2 family multidrug resistance protein